MRNIEVLRDYFLGHDPQLKETLADNSLRLIGIPGNQFVVRQELINDLKQLKKEMKDYIDEVLEELDVEEIKELERKVRQLEEAVAELENWKNHNDLVSESELATALASYYTKTEIDLIIQNLSGLKYEVVEQLPTHNIKTDTIYLVPHGQGDEDIVRKLTGNIVLTNGVTPDLEEGLYYTGNYLIRRESDSSLVGIFGHNEIVYYDATDKCFSGSLNYIVDFQGSWEIGTIAQLRASVADDNTTVPLNSAVYNAIHNQ